MSPEEAVEMFKWFKKETKADDVAAALLAIATTPLKVQPTSDHLAHEICIGIRKGLFGAAAEGNRDIAEVARIIADS